MDFDNEDGGELTIEEGAALLSPDAEEAADEAQVDEVLADGAQAEALDGEAPQGEALADESSGTDEDEGALDVEIEPGLDDQTLIALDGIGEVPLGELKAHFDMSRDFEYERGELKEAYERLDADRQQVEKFSAATQQAFEGLMNALGAIMPPEPDAGLAATDPAAYQEQLGQYSKVNDFVARLFEQGGEAQQAQHAYQSQLHEKMLAEQGQLLLKALPFLSSPVKRDAFHKENREFVQQFGFTPDDYDRVMDHRLMSVLHYAKIGKRATDKQKTMPKKAVSKPVKGGKGVPALAGKSAKSRALQNLRQSGSIEDAAALLAA